MQNSLRQSFVTLMLIVSALIGATGSCLGEEKLYLSGRVKDAITNKDLTDAFVLLYDSIGNVRDSIQCNRGSRYVDGEMIPMGYYSFQVERKDSTYVFDIVCDGYETATITYEVKNIGKREEYRNIPMTMMKRAPIKLGEVTVKASKIKFYNKGDTIVYNADAFQLAEGSMLDGLISQLPGVELNDDGQIKVNGEFVESLLLNGKEFLDGNNQLMLENIAAYTVKNVEVYRGQTAKEKWENDSTKEKHLTMDVKLKREYMIGWIVNAQGGIGTENRYTGRLFANWFSPTSSVTLIGNINNLNDNRKPGKSDTWTPERMPSGTRIYKMGALNYQHETKDEWLSVNGHVTFEQTTRNNSTTTARTNFLSSGDTYENRFSRSYNRNAQLETRHYLNMHNDAVWGYAMAVGRYKTADSHSDNLSGTFSVEQKDMTLKALDALYTASSPETLDAVVNRANTRSLGKSREYEVQFYPGFDWKLPKTQDRLSYEFGVKYNNKKETDWDDYTINYGADPNPAVRTRQYRDGQPNHTLTLTNNLRYSTSIKNVYLSINYEYRFADRWRDSHSFALDRLADMGVFGVLPEGYASAIDPDNSYTSHQMQNQHSLQVRGSWYAWLKKKSILQIMFAPEVRLLHDHMDYRRAGILYPIRHDFVNFSLDRFAATIEYSWNQVGEGRRRRYVNTISFDTRCTPKNPNLLDMVDVINDSDPLNISQGNPDLRPQHSYDMSLKWSFKPDRSVHPLNNTISVSYNFVDDAIVRGYTYDTRTGVRHNRSYNLDGNRSYRGSNYFSLQFGKGDCLTLSSSTSADRSVYADMIGIDTEAPTHSKVNNMIFSQGVDLAWNFGKQTLRLKGNVMTRHSSSTREDFRDIDAQTYTCSVLGNFRIPGGFGVETDLSLYTRRGYGVKELDTSDLIWNMRLSWTPKKSRWSIFLDGFDLLHQLSNVNYAVTATGRTVSYSNALPRYFLLSAQYRLNIQPKKKKRK